MQYTVEPIAHIHNNYKEKFGIPRQSGLARSVLSAIVFDEKFRDENALRGLEGYSHIWLLWMFDNNNSDKSWSATVRPPRLGGNKRMGVFSTRSPYHPNRIGLSCVKLVSIEKTKDSGTVIYVQGADLLDNTPIIDIKPYLSFTDSHPEAKCAFTEDTINYILDVKFQADVSGLSCELKTEIEEILKYDPRPSYQDDENRVYSMRYSDYDIRFTVKDLLLTVIEINKMNGSEK